jgi:hypothetical protein
MTEPDTEIQRATKNAERMAVSLGVRIFLYQTVAGKPVFKPIHPALPDEHLELIGTFEPPLRQTSFDQSLPPSPTPEPAST